ncbi:TPA: hypothetical protein ACGWER_001742 [Streptococcus agalactiae]|nr:hypothetical protein [Streptococcus agalactiae]HEO2267390.1 hypothetical protein [Streptococcus agalactiae]HEO7770316.1 hypothetical protein [Streptococcus agalactiae]
MDELVEQLSKITSVIEQDESIITGTGIDTDQLERLRRLKAKVSREKTIFNNVLTILTDFDDFLDQALEAAERLNTEDN